MVLHGGALIKGEKAGHPFRGNQHVAGKGGGAPNTGDAGGQPGADYKGKGNWIVGNDGRVVGNGKTRGGVEGVKYEVKEAELAGTKGFVVNQSYKGADQGRAIQILFNSKANAKAEARKWNRHVANALKDRDN